MRHFLNFLVVAAVLLTCTAFTTFYAFAQSTEVRGIVIGSDNNEPLAGVAIHLKENPKIYTTSNENGEYKLTLPDNKGSVVFELLGYDTKEIKASDSFLFTLVTMIVQGNTLDEVVVVGFGTQKKTSVVGAVQAVKPDHLVTPSSNLTTSFAGNIPGVISTQSSGEPGYDNAKFFIRGRSTFGYDSGALIVLDGVEITSAMLNNIPSEAIESLSVLKDATATALYGSRGANGVIIVTTKEGRNSERLIVNATADNTWSMPTDVQGIADGVDYMLLYNEARFNDSKATGTEYIPFYSDEQIEGTRQKLNPYVFPNNNWYKKMFKKSTMGQRVNVSVRGGGKRVNYFMNASIYNENGILRKPKETPLDIKMNNKKYMFQSNVTTQITKTTKVSMKLNMQIQYNNSPYESTSTLFYWCMRANPTRFPAVLPAQEGDAYVRYGNNDTWDTGNTDLNPYARMSSGYKQRYYSWTTAHINVDQDLSMLIKGLSARGIASFYNYSFASTNRYMTPYYFKVDSYNKNADGTYSYTTTSCGNPGNTYLTSTVSHDGYHEWSVQGSLNYARVFGKHDVAADLVYHMKERVNNATSADEDQLLPFREQGLAGRATYNYAQRYFVEANFGYNGSENFKKGHRFGFFPSVAVGWTISNEQFWYRLGLRNSITNLKLRASYGLVGNDALSVRFPYLTSVDMTEGNARTYSFGLPANVQGLGFVSTWGNEEASWETSKKLNVGIDIGLFKDFTLSVDYFNEHRKDIFMQRQSIESIAGFGNTLPYGNLGKVKNSGIDLSLNYNHVVDADFTYSIRGTMTYAHNEIVYRDEPSNISANLSSIGYSMDSPQVLVADGLFTSDDEIKSSPAQDFGSYYVGDVKYKDVNGDNVVNANDYVYAKVPTMPEVQYGLGGSIQYHKWDANIMFQGSARFNVLMSNFHPFCDTEHYGYGITKYIADNHWSWDNNTADAAFPRLTATPSNNNTRNSTQYLKRGDYLRLRNLEIGYKITKNFRVYVSGSNLFTITGFKYWDPEIGSGNGLQYPLQKTIRIGLQFNY